MKKEFNIVCRVINTTSADILTTSGAPVQNGNVTIDGSTANGMGAPVRGAEGPKFE